MRRAVVLASLLAGAGARAEEPVRAQRRVGLTVEGGWKGSAGLIGVGLSYNARPSVAVQVAFGVGMGTGPALGLRARWNLLETQVTPFVGGGLTLLMGQERYYEPTLVAQAVGGVEWLARAGFTVRVEGGYSLRTGPLLTASAREQGVDGTWAEDRSGSGWLLAGALGWTF